MKLWDKIQKAGVESVIKGLEKEIRHLHRCIKNLNEYIESQKGLDKNLQYLVLLYTESVVRQRLDKICKNSEDQHE
jgi:hypothetical protein